MEELKRYAPAKEHMLRFGVVLLILILVVAVSFLLGRVVSADAEAAALNADVAGRTSETLPAPTQPAASPLEQENADLRQQVADLTAQVQAAGETAAASQKEIEALRADLAAAEAENASLILEMDVVQDENDRLTEQFGMTYYVVYEVRRTVSFPPAEEILRVTTIVTREVYESMSVGDTMPAVSGNLSLPSGSWGLGWTATVVNMYFQPTWDRSGG